MRFTIELTDIRGNEITLRKKTLNLDIPKDTDNYNIFSSVLTHIEENYEKVFSVKWPDVSFNFKVSKGKVWQTYVISLDDCPHCGTHAGVWMDEDNYEEEENDFFQQTRHDDI